MQYEKGQRIALGYNICPIKGEKSTILFQGSLAMSHNIDRCLEVSFLICNKDSAYT